MKRWSEKNHFLANEHKTEAEEEEVFLLFWFDVFTELLPAENWVYWVYWCCRISCVWRFF